MYSKMTDSGNNSTLGRAYFNLNKTNNFNTSANVSANHSLRNSAMGMFAKTGIAFNKKTSNII